MADVAAQLHACKLHLSQALVGPGKGLIKIMALGDGRQHPATAGLQLAIGIGLHTCSKKLAGVLAARKAWTFIADGVTQLRCVWITSRSSHHTGAAEGRDGERSA